MINVISTPDPNEEHLVPQEWQGYHLYRCTDEDTDEFVGFELVLDENNQPIPDYVCLCAAHSSIECCCGAWDRPLPDDM